MGLVIGQQKTVDLPLDSGESAVIRKLSHRKLSDAAAAQQSQGIGFMREVDRIKKSQEANIANYHRDSLLEKGIVSWTLDPAITDSNRVEVLSELDEPTAAFLSQAIFDYSRPETQDEAGEGPSGLSNI